MCLGLAALIAAIDARAAVHQYTVRIDAALTTLEITACFDGAAPRRLEPANRRARDFLRNPHILRDETRVPLSLGRQGLRTGAVEADGCVAYTVDAARAVDDGVDRNAARSADFLMLRAAWWLWLPDSSDAGKDVALAFELPGGMAVSAPWLETAPGRFQLGNAPPYWPTLVAIGRFAVTPVPVGKTTLRLSVLPADPPADAKAMAAWLSEAATAVSDLYGRFPIPAPQVLVVPLGPRGEAVPWAQVLRGGRPAAHFFVDQTRPLSEFRADWTATHELSHLALPYLGTSNAWLSEGMASYYQNVLRARAGLLTEREAWQKLHDGFQRGVRGTRGLTLADASRNMRRDGAFMRVYWSGAAVALKTDIALRVETDGRHSLATALDCLQRCCLPADRRWSADELIDRVDAITGTDVMRRLYEQHVDSRRFPELEADYNRLGLSVVGGRVELREAAPLAGIRAAIMGTKGPR